MSEQKMSKYGTSNFSLGRAIWGARVNRIRAAVLQRWGAAVVALEDENTDLKAKLENLPGGSPDGAWETVKRMREFSDELEAKLEAMERAMGEIANRIVLPGYVWTGTDAAIMHEMAERALAAAQEED